MQLQDQLLASLTDQMRLGAKIRRDSNISATGTYALDAVEKNANVSGSLAAAISQVNSDLVVERNRITLLSNSGVSAADGELVDIRNGANGTTYNSAGAAVRDQILNYRDIAIGTTQPSASYTKAWVDTSPKSSADFFYVPEVRDDIVSASDVWSSSKVRSEIDIATKDVIVSDTAPDPTDTKVWIDTSSTGFFWLPEINDEEVSETDTFSSQKIMDLFDALREELGLTGGAE